MAETESATFVRFAGGLLPPPTLPFLCSLYQIVLKFSWHVFSITAMSPLSMEDDVLRYEKKTRPFCDSLSVESCLSVC